MMGSEPSGPVILKDLSVSSNIKQNLSRTDSFLNSLGWSTKFVLHALLDTVALS